ncbi:hypothetical protein D3C76_524720 [compost metagenome]
MTTDDDVVHAQGKYCVLDGGGHAAVHLAVGRNHVTDVTGHEQVARRALGDQLRNDARVGTGDEHGTGLLRGGELLEQLLLLREDVMVEAQEAIDNVLKGGIGALGRSLGSNLGWVLDGHDSSS